MDHPTKRFYIATGFQNKAEHAKVKHLFELHGWTCTYDWTLKGEPNSPIEELAQIAEEEIKGVLEADVLIVLLPGGRGTHTELGAALGAGIPVVLWTPDAAMRTAPGMASVFYCHHSVSIVDHLDGVDRLLVVAEQMRREWQHIASRIVAQPQRECAGLEQLVEIEWLLQTNDPLAAVRDLMAEKERWEKRVYRLEARCRFVQYVANGHADELTMEDAKLREAAAPAA